MLGPLLVLMGLAAPTVDGPMGGPQPPTLRVVCFTPADVEPPAGVQRRLTQVADCAEGLILRWMKHWKYEPAAARMFRRTDGGAVEVLLVKGQHPRASGRYDKPGFAGEVIDQATRMDGVAGRQNLWWIFVYLGDPPTRFAEYLGHGDAQGGGWALVNYDSRPGEIRPDEALGVGFNETFTVKGCIHELGHAFGLPHLGPNPGKGLGNSLMGPNMGVYFARSPRPRDGRVYLTEAAAAMLWKHPLFSGTAQDRALLPDVRLEDYRARFDRARRRVELTGKLVSNHPAHSVVVIDDIERRQGSYWSRSYAARLQADGSFRVIIDEPVPADGLYRIVFCFQNGAVTGDGKGHGDQSAIVKSYRFNRGVLQFDP
ncbi:MAG TPA: hypothetical protein VF590_07120 [Isosphaeraceae bacterium]|jgi:hypothetical protein